MVSAKLVAKLLGHDGSIYALEKGFQEGQIITGGSDRRVALWNLDAFEPENWSVNVGSVIYSLLHLKEKSLLLIGTMSGSIHIIDLEAKQEVKNLKHHQNGIFDLKYSLSSGHIYAASEDGTVSVISIDDLSFIKAFKLCDKKVRNIDISPANDEIAIACGDGTVRILDLETLEEVQILNPGRASVNAVKFHPDGKHLLTGEKDAYLHVWRKNGLYELEEAVPAHNYAIYSIDFSPNGKYFATASRDKTVKIWDADTFQFLLRIDKDKYDGHVHSVNKLVWCTFNNYLATAGDDRSVRIWEISET